MSLWFVTFPVDVKPMICCDTDDVRPVSISCCTKTKIRQKNLLACAKVRPWYLVREDLGACAAVAVVELARAGEDPDERRLAGVDVARHGDPDVAGGAAGRGLLRPRAHQHLRHAPAAHAHIHTTHTVSRRRTVSR